MKNKIKQEVLKEVRKEMKQDYVDVILDCECDCCEKEANVFEYTKDNFLCVSCMKEHIIDLTLKKVGEVIDKMDCAHKCKPTKDSVVLDREELKKELEK